MNIPAGLTSPDEVIEKLQADLAAAEVEIGKLAELVVHVQAKRDKAVVEAERLRGLLEVIDKTITDYACNKAVLEIRTMVRYELEGDTNGGD